MKNKTLIIFLVLVSAAIIFGVININRPLKKEVVKKEEVKPKEAAAPSKYKPAPEFALSDTNGEQRRLSEFKGKVVILDFWATWCPPCRAEIPHFIDLYDKYKARGLEIIGVSLDWNGRRIVPSFMEENGINYTMLLDGKAAADLFGGIDSIPTTFILDRYGNIRNRYVGYQEKEVFERDIKELL